MSHKIHLRQTVGGRTVCNSRHIGNGKFRFNGRREMEFIPESKIVKPDEFRATPSADRCAHCADKFLETMNRRRKAQNKPLYSNAFTKDLVS